MSRVVHFSPEVISRAEAREPSTPPGAIVEETAVPFDRAGVALLNLTSPRPSSSSKQNPSVDAESAIDARIVHGDEVTPQLDGICVNTLMSPDVLPAAIPHNPPTLTLAAGIVAPGPPYA